MPFGLGRKQPEPSPEGGQENTAGWDALAARFESAFPDQPDHHWKPNDVLLPAQDGVWGSSEVELVLEKSDGYGAFEGSAEWADKHLGGCAPVTRADLSRAWSRPYARRSLLRRFLTRLNGASDAQGDPSERDPSTEPPAVP